MASLTGLVPVWKLTRNFRAGLSHAPLRGCVITGARSIAQGHARCARGTDECVRPHTIIQLLGFAEDELSGGGAAFEVGLDQ